MRLFSSLAAVCAVLILAAVPTVVPSSFVLSAATPTAPAVGGPLPAIALIRGVSGNLCALIGHRKTFANDAAIAPVLSAVPEAATGVHSLGMVAPDGDSLIAVLLEPFAANRGKTRSRYRTGTWPTTGLAERDPMYAPPTGYISVTPDNANTLVSKRFRLRDFLTHDQQDVWPKVLVLRPTLLDKLELIGDSLAGRGLPSKLFVMSGFRTPQYNSLGVGDKGGRASNSRHMYGDAADVFVDADGDGWMDDLNRDGRVTRDDAQVLLAVAEAVEARHPHLTGGLSAYSTSAGHGPFVHVDARGARARW
jgi:Peptidase M15